MDITSWVVFQSFLQKRDLEKRNALVNCLAEEDRNFFTSLPSSPEDVSMEIDLTDILDEIHYSWLAPLIRTHTEDEIRLLLSALQEKQVKGLKKILLFTNHLYPLSSKGKYFLKKHLLNTFLKEKDVFPLQYLPEDSLNDLLALDAEQIPLLASFLGIRDLSVEMRLIIDTVKIRQITDALTEHERLYLKTLMQQKEPLVFKPMGLAAWNGNAETLKGLLLQRGINRLAKALVGHHESLIWHITHRLNVDLGKMLQSFLTPVESAKASTLLSNQVIDLIPYIQNLSGSDLS